MKALQPTPRPVRPPSARLKSSPASSLSTQSPSMINTSGITPRGHRLLILPDTVSEKVNGIVVMAPTELKREQMAQTEGTVVEVSAGCWQGGQFAPGELAWCQVGDRIIFAKFAGLQSQGADKKIYRLINDEDVVALKQEKGNG